jgi:CRP-like cAMP-binding protein
VQSSGEAWVANCHDLQRLVDRRASLLLAFSRYMWSLAHDIAMHAAFAQLQDIRARVAGWILLSAHRGQPDQLTLTHVQLASMLGVRRSSVTLAAMELKQLGLLDYQRGRIRILDRPGLEALSCWVAGQ